MTKRQGSSSLASFQRKQLRRTIVRLRVLFTSIDARLKLRKSELMVDVFCARCGQSFDSEEGLKDHWMRYGYCYHPELEEE